MPETKEELEMEILKTQLEVAKKQLATAGTPQANSTSPNYNPGIAAVLSFFIPGAGQIYRGNVLTGMAWLFFVVGGYMAFIAPGLVLHAACVLCAALK